MTYCYRVREWDRWFENAASRKVDRLHYVMVPNKQHGMGFTRIMLQSDGAAILGIWYLIIEACSQQKCPRLGYLTDDGTASGNPWTIDDLAERWRRTVQELSRALDVLTSPRIAWVETVEANPSATPTGPQADTSTTPREPQGDTSDRSVEERRVEKRRGEDAPDAPPPVENSLDERRRLLRRMLAQKRFATDDTAFEEWVGLLNEEAQVRSMKDTAEFLRWLKVEAKREGVIGRYAPAYEALTARWRHRQQQAQRQTEEEAT